MLKRLTYIAFVTVSIALFCTLLASCGGGDVVPKNPDKNTEKDTIDDSDAITEVIQGLSSSVEMAALIKNSGVPFSKKYLSSTENMENYNTSFRQALKLGVLGADLGYLNMYDKSSLIVSYIGGIKTLTDNLKIDKYFDFTTMRRLATNNENLDSLMFLSVSCFNRMDKQLRDDKRSHLSALMITGVWIEGMFLATSVAKEKKIRTIIERIGDQKIILQQLAIILSVYKSRPEFRELCQDIDAIADLYKGVKITVVQGDPIPKNVDGRLVIEQTETSNVEISDDLLSKIIVKIEQVRNKLTSL